MLIELMESEQLAEVVENQFGNLVLQNILNTYLPPSSDLRANLLMSIVEALPYFQKKKILIRWGD